MCGFAGYFGGSNSFSQDMGNAVLKSMTNVISSRGPDDSGHWFNAEPQIGLGHRRLSIVDLSAAGHQPMGSMSGRYVIAFNGEIYNHKLLRNELNELAPSLNWRGHSDTETLLAGFEVWGIRGTIDRAIGMFAFAVWDKIENILTLGRDRIGEKPLYYGRHGSTFLFGSELKALKQHPAFEPEVNRASLALLLRHNYIPAPHSIYHGISKLQPGCLLSVSSSQGDPVITSYWSAVDVAESGVRKPYLGTPENAIEDLDKLVNSAIAQQMVADVPLGAFLSGGIDSSAVVASMQAQSTRPVKTFTIGFHEKDYNEAQHAKAVAKHLGTDHTELYVTANEAIEVIPKLPTLYCEPFSDSSQIPTFLVSQLAKQHVTVSLSGDGGDELFCGYNRYELTNRLWSKLSKLPVPLRKFMGKGITSVSVDSWNKLSKSLPGKSRFSHIGDKLHKGAAALASQSVDELYLELVSHHRNPADLIIGGCEAPTYLVGNTPDLIGLDDVQRMMALDQISYLPDDILVKVDRAAMGNSLETRVPFLDHRIIEFAWTLPQSMKIKDGVTKWPLRQLLYRQVPQALIDRPKMGFGIPIHEWLRGSLHDWAEALLDESRLKQEGFFRVEAVRKIWSEHVSRKRNSAYLLWNILMFQAWLEVQ